jgi:hypothetical protein
MNDLNSISQELLKANLQYIQEFSRKRLENTNILVNYFERELLKTHDPADKHRLLMSYKAATEMYGDILEQSTIMFMSGVTPLMKLIEHYTNMKEKSFDTDLSVLFDDSTETKKIKKIIDGEIDNLDELYKPYED